MRCLPLLCLLACQHTAVPDPQSEAAFDSPAADLPAGAAPSCHEDGLIRPVPDEGPHARYLQYGFDRYIEAVAPSGGSVRLYAQDQVRDAQLHRAYTLLRFFLADAEGTRWGHDKSDVFDAMAANEAVLMMPNGHHIPGQEPPLDAQPLFADETPVEGDAWYLSNDYEHRDAAFEEIFHLVHDMGIGTWMPGARSAYQTALAARAEEAIGESVWGIPVDPGVRSWLRELRAEDSLAQEYIAAVLDSAFGLWGPWDEADGGMWGIYLAKTRTDVQSLDPDGWSLLRDFLPEVITYETRIDPSFEGTFLAAFDPAQPYTHKSQYLRDLTLTGTHDAGIVANHHDNTLRGNAGNNTLDGGEGFDTVVYCGPSTAYTWSASGADIVVEGPDGRDVLTDVEQLWFADQKVAL